MQVLSQHIFLIHTLCGLTTIPKGNGKERPSCGSPGPPALGQSPHPACTMSGLTNMLPIFSQLWDAANETRRDRLTVIRCYQTNEEADPTLQTLEYNRHKIALIGVVHLKTAVSTESKA